MKVAARPGLAEVDTKLREHLTLPSGWYTDPDVYRFELENIFPRSWQVAGPRHKLQNPGDHIVCEVGAVPIVVTVGTDGALRGFVNVCRHRGHPVALHDGNRKALQCRYHGWTYDLNGNLCGARGCELDDDFEKADFSLLSVSVDTWNAFVFVNPDPQAPPLREAFPEFEPQVTRLGLDFSEYKYHGASSYDVPANWKIWVENSIECYHCPNIHARSYADAFEVSHTAFEEVNDGRLIAQSTKFNPRARTYKGRSRSTGADFRGIHLWPASAWNDYGVVAYSSTMVPTSPDSCRVVTHAFRNPSYSGEVSESWVKMLDQVLNEDIEVIRGQQSGLRSGMVTYGRLMAARETSIAHFHRLVLDAYSAAQ